MNRVKFLSVIQFLLMCSCEKFVQVDAPKNETISETVFLDEKTANSAVLGIYSEMMTFAGFMNAGGNGITNVLGLSADEFQELPTAGEFQQNLVKTNNAILQGTYWQAGYKYIWYANSVLEGIAKSNLSQDVKSKLEGEVKFIRALSNFYLVNLFGDIPMVTTTDYRVNSTTNRTSQEEIYLAIIEDLLDARDKLNDEYVTGSRTRPNKAVAIALLARIHLYKNDWESASTAATTLINNGLYQLEQDLNDVFLAGSAEAIWQLKPVIPGRNTNDGEYFIQMGTYGYLSLTPNLIDSFEEDDQRRTSWTGTYDNGSTLFHYPLKYKLGEYGQPLNEFLMVLRLAEMYLIRAEARANLGDLTGAQEDINVLRVRAGLSAVNLTTKEDVLNTIYQEQRIEMFAELGHRWMNLKRTNRIDQVLGSLKDSWRSTAALFPIPQSEIENNANLLPQNPGY